MKGIENLIGKFNLTYQAVHQIKVFQKGQSYVTEVRLTNECQKDLNNLIKFNNLILNKGKPILIHSPDLVIQSETATTVEACKNDYHDFHQVPDGQVSLHTNGQHNNPNLLVRMWGWGKKSSEMNKINLEIWD